MSQTKNFSISTVFVFCQNTFSLFSFSSLDTIFYRQQHRQKLQSEEISYFLLLDGQKRKTLWKSFQCFDASCTSFLWRMLFCLSNAGNILRWTLNNNDKKPSTKVVRRKINFRFAWKYNSFFASHLLEIVLTEHWAHKEKEWKRKNENENSRLANGMQYASFLFIVTAFTEQRNMTTKNETCSVYFLTLNLFFLLCSFASMVVIQSKRKFQPNDDKYKGSFVLFIFHFAGWPRRNWRWAQPTRSIGKRKEKLKKANKKKYEKETTRNMTYFDFNLSHQKLARSILPKAERESGRKINQMNGIDHLCTRSYVIILPVQYFYGRRSCLECRSIVSNVQVRLQSIQQ